MSSSLMPPVMFGSPSLWSHRAEGPSRDDLLPSMMDVLCRIGDEKQSTAQDLGLSKGQNMQRWQ